MDEEVKTFPSIYKKKDYFSNSSVIAIDIDDCSCTPREFIKRLSRKPNFWYTSYSNRVTKNGKQNGYRFRLVYVFFRPLDDYYYYRFCAQMIIDRIYNECQDRTCEAASFKFRTPDCQYCFDGWI